VLSDIAREYPQVLDPVPTPSGRGMYLLSLTDQPGYFEYHRIEEHVPRRTPIVERRPSLRAKPPEAPASVTSVSPAAADAPPPAAAETGGAVAPESKAAVGRWSRLAGAAVSKLAAAARYVALAATVYGAWTEASRTGELEIQLGRGRLNAAVGFAGTFLIGLGAGIVDDALAAITLPIGSAPVIENWDFHGSGPVQHAAGEVIRRSLVWANERGY
jgi:hypothetical protein